jgi:cytochrome b6-f complex iron-sulfur subunit
MSATQIFILAVAGVTVLVAAGLFTVALRRGEPAAPRRERRPEPVPEPVPVAQAVVTGLEEPAAAAAPGPVPDPIEQREEVSGEEFGVTRRQFFNRAVLAVFGVFLAQFALGGLAFMWPKLRAGGFGGKIDVGDVTDLLEGAHGEAGTITPVFVPAAQAYIVPFEGSAEDSSFESIADIVIAGGLMALWQRCVHLGCRVPTCLPSQGFECPCHGSKYNFHGEYEAGPAPRNLDRFAVAIDDSNRFIVDTGAVFETARAKEKTIAYPQGPSCLSAAGE